MAEHLKPSAGLAVQGQPAPKVVIPPAKPTNSRRTADSRVATLRQRAEALKKKRAPRFRVIVKLDEVDYDIFLTICERQNLDPGAMATRLFLDGVRRFRNIPEEKNEGIGDEVPVAFDRFGAEYRQKVSAQQNGGDAEQMKKLVKELGVPTT